MKTSETGVSTFLPCCCCRGDMCSPLFHLICCTAASGDCTAILILACLHMVRLTHLPAGMQFILKTLRLRRQETARLVILNHLSGVLKPGRLTLLLGPPSSGKSTLLKALADKLHSSGLYVSPHELVDFMMTVLWACSVVVNNCIVCIFSQLQGASWAENQSVAGGSNAESLAACLLLCHADVRQCISLGCSCSAVQKPHASSELPPYGR